MANLTRLRLPGFWIQGSVVDPEEFEALDAMRLLLINASGGSAHAPTLPIILGGSGLRMTGLLDVDGPLQQDAASAWELSGPITLMSGGSLSMNFGATMTVKSGAMIVLQSGSSTLVYGNMTWQAGNWPKLTSRAIERNKWRLASVAYTTGGGAGPDSPAAWVHWDDSAAVTPAISTVATTGSSGRRILVELLDLPPGATLSTVTIRSRGIAGDAAVHMPTYTLMRWKGSSSNTMSITTTDAHTGANWTSDQVDTVVTCNAQSTIDGSYNYGVLIESPYGDVAAAVKLFAFTCALTVSSFQL